MSSGQYELRRENSGSRKSRSGLDLCVMDHHIGMTRRRAYAVRRRELHGLAFPGAGPFRTPCRRRLAASSWMPCSWMKDSAPWMKRTLQAAIARAARADAGQTARSASSAMWQNCASRSRSRSSSRKTRRASAPPA